MFFDHKCLLVLFISLVLSIESTHISVLRECTEVCNAAYWATHLHIHLTLIYILRNNEKNSCTNVSEKDQKFIQEYFRKLCNYQ